MDTKFNKRPKFVADTERLRKPRKASKKSRSDEEDDYYGLPDKYASKFKKYK